MTKLKMIGMNEWSFSGEIFYFKELEGEFSHSLRIRGKSSRGMSNQIAEVGCLVSGSLAVDIQKRRIGLYSKVALSGHLESWIRTDGRGKPKVKLMLIADYIIESA